MAERDWCFELGGDRLKQRTDRIDLYNQVCLATSRITTRAYSTSFSLGIRALGPEIREGVYAIYGFVRLVDEVVDSFQGFDQQSMFEDLREDTWRAIDAKISTNPILNAFQNTYHQYDLDRTHVEQFFWSMEQDLSEQTYDRATFEKYVGGSAEVVGLMCLKVFVRGDSSLYSELAPAAIRLGAAFQKVNFLRDIREDFVELNRSYFPDVNVSELDTEAKSKIENEIADDLAEAYKGIIRLPRDSRFGVYLAYNYYRQLLKRIRRTPSAQILNRRIRVPDYQKGLLLLLSYTRHRLNIV